MNRDLQRLATATFDAIVIGGGVYGLRIAHELSRRGITPCLLERDDFAANTSFNSLKTLHGGIRELQQGAVPRVRQFVRERRAVARLAPHLVRPLPFVIPTSLRHPKALMRAFLAAYDLLARDRNDAVDPSRHLAASRVISRADCLDLNPLIDPHGVTGGAVWHDYQLHSPERFAVALIESMVRREAAALNYTEVVAGLRSGGALSGVRVRDRLSGDTLDVRAPVVVNAAGPWAPAVLERLGVGLPAGQRIGWSLAMNLVLDVPALSNAVGGVAGGRFLFLVPWRSGSIVGTSHEAAPVEGGRASITGRGVEALLDDARTAFPNARLSNGDIRLVHRGLLPAPVAARGDALLKASLVHDHAADGLKGLVTVIGARYTTAGATAAAVASRIGQKLGRSVDTVRREERLPAAEMGDVEQFERSEVSASTKDPALIRRLIAAYGTGYRTVVRLMDERPALALPTGPACEITGAEILRAARNEMAVHLTDALIRRTGAGAGGHPGPEAARAAASIMAVELGWSADQVNRELAEVDEAYRLPAAGSGRV